MHESRLAQSRLAQRGRNGLPNKSWNHTYGVVIECSNLPVHEMPVRSENSIYHHEMQVFYLYDTLGNLGVSKKGVVRRHDAVVSESIKLYQKRIPMNRCCGGRDGTKFAMTAAMKTPG